MNVVELCQKVYLRPLLTIALALTLSSPPALAQSRSPAASVLAPERTTQRTATLALCASNTVDARGCDLKLTGTSDEKLINEAIANCSRSNGCKIVLRNGVYNISSPIVIDRSFVTLEGESWPFWGSYMRPWTGTASPVSAVGTQGAVIAAATVGFNPIEIRHRNLPDNGEQRHRGIRIANLHVIGKSYSGNCVDSLSSGNHQDDSGSFENLMLTRCAYGLYISVDNGWINKNNMQDLAVGGAFIAGVNSRFTDNIVWDVGGRGLLTAVRGMVVAGNTFGDTLEYALDAQGPGVAVITGNEFGPTSASAGGSSINLACSGCVVTGNYFDQTVGGYRNQRRTAPVIRVANSRATNNVIVGNSFVPGGTEAGGVFAVDVAGSMGNVVLGNSITAGFNNGSATTIHAGVGNLVSLNKGDVSATAQGGQTISFQPGLLTSIPSTKGAFTRFTRGAVVDSIELSAIAFDCSVNPAVTLYKCRASRTCADPEVIGSATLAGAGQVADGVIASAVIAAGDYVAWGFSEGKCAQLNVAASAQVRVE